MAQDKDLKTPNVPPLRFPGFTDEWKKVTLGEIGTGFNYGLNAPAKEYDGMNKYIRITDIEESTGAYSEADVVSPNGKLSDEYIVNDNDILLARTGASTGKSYLYAPKDGRLYFAGFLIRFNVNKANPYFIYTNLHTRNYWRWVNIMSARSGQPGINSQEYSSYQLYIPSRKEQNKIANLLQLLDERISTQNKIIDNLQSLIKGLNDKFHDEVQGEFVSFSEIGTAYSGLSGKSGDDFGQGSPFITYLNVYQNNVINEDDFGLVTIAANESQHTISHGDVLFTLSSETPDEVGIGSVYLGKSDKFYLNSFCFGVSILTKGRIYPPYLAYLVSSTKFRKFVYPLAQGSTRFNLQKNDFMKKKFILPSIEDQRKISNTLDVLSQKLTTEQHLNELYKIQKEHLLRNLFI